MSVQLITIDLSPAKLELEVSKLLKEAAGRYGLSVRHNGTSTNSAPGNRPDIEVFSDDVHINVEVTKLMRVAQTNSEATPVTSHLDNVATRYPAKQVFGLFISPATFERTRQLFHHYNNTYAAFHHRKIAAMDFNTFNILASWLCGSAARSFRTLDLLTMLNGCAGAENDQAVLEYVNAQYIRSPSLDEAVSRIKQEKLDEKYARLGPIFRGIHDDLRSVCGLGPTEAFHELSKLVFLKMYEEQAVLEASRRGRVIENRFTTKYIEEERRRRRARRAKHPIIAFFEEVRDEFVAEGLFDPGESISIQPDRNEGSYIDDIVRAVEDYSFIDPDVPLRDIKGMIYEQFLGLSLKNTDLGQFFTPERIIDFMIKVAELRVEDKVLDPACGTGRFLVHAMNDMISKTHHEPIRRRIKQRQLFGNEMSPYVAKIAKMNMFVHGDGRANVHQCDSLTWVPRDAEKPKVILTNPPLGDVNFSKLVGHYGDNEDWYRSMDVIEKITMERAGVTRTSVSRHELKGGALFLNKFVHFLRPGGRVLTVMDEAVLNTDEYFNVRRFILRNFYVHAVFSLTDDAFKHASKTATKTSILFLEKKEAPDRTQIHPIFFAHASQVGENPRGKPCPNDLIDPNRPKDIYRAWVEFRGALEENKLQHGGRFDERFFIFPPRRLDGVEDGGFSAFSYFVVPFGKVTDRLEYKWYDPTYDPIEARLQQMETVRLAEIVDPTRTTYGLTETGLEQGDIPFINIENLRPDATIDLRDVRYVLDDNRKIKDQHYTRRDDILISRSRLPGIAAVVSERNENIVYGSYMIRFHLHEEQGRDFVPEYVALFVNSIFGRAQVHRLKSGSNGYNINSGQLGELKILRLPHDKQVELVGRIERQRVASTQLGMLMRRFQDTAEVSFIRSCLGVRSPEELEILVNGLQRQLGPVVESLEEFNIATNQLADLEDARRYFTIRPTFHTRVTAEE